MPSLPARLTLVTLFAALSTVAVAQEKIVIAHRGASGYVPEHTLEAYAIAHAMGADYIEPDLVFTKDGVFICLHDIHLEATTNVKEVFPSRKRADGRYYAADFTLAEIKLLQAVERLPSRFPKGTSDFEVPTFAEMIELVQGLNKTTKREAGIYPELKEPAWHRENGLPMEEAFLSIVARYGYTGKDAKIFVQCFESEPLMHMRDVLKSALPQIQLISNDERHRPMTTREGLAKIAKYANGIGPDVRIVLGNPDFVKWAHELGLQVHPYTLRADMLPNQNETFETLVQKLFKEIGVDGAFTDHPDRLSAAR